MAKSIAVRSIGHLTDEEIVEKIQNSDNSGLVGLLYERYASKVYRKCLSMVKDQVIAQDLTHDIFIKVFTHIGSYKYRSKFSTWLYSITYNYCLDYLRKNKKKKQVSIENNPLKDTADAEVEHLNDIAHIKATRLKILLEEIKPKEKMILLMKYKEGLSLNDITQILDISESAAKMRIKRAKEKVKSLYNLNYSNIIY